MTEPTADPEVVIESREGDTITYRRSDGLVWTVTGRCTGKGLCLLGSIALDGKTVLDSLDTIQRYCRANGVDRPDSALDVPLGPSYDSNCCPMIVKRLDG